MKILKKAFLTATVALLSLSAEAQTRKELAASLRARETTGSLFEHALLNFNAMSKQIENSYSRTLDSLQNVVNTGVQNKRRTIFLDPQKMLGALALGLGVEDAIKTNLAAEGIDTSNYSISEERQPYFIGSGKTALGTFFATHSPAFTVLHGKKASSGFGIVIPIPAIEPSPYLSLSETMLLVNTHESHHARKPGIFRPTDDEDLSAHESRLASVANDADLSERYAATHKDEMHADVGAFGDAVRQGADTSIIDRGIMLRRHTAVFETPVAALTHLSVNGLAALKDTIAAIGLEKFRTLSSIEAGMIYDEIAEKEGFSGAQIQAVARYVSGTDEDRARMEKEAETDTELSRAVTNGRYTLNDPRLGALTPPPAPSPADIDSVASAMGKIDALSDMINHTFDRDKKITPLGMIVTHGQMQDGAVKNFDAARTQAEKLFYMEYMAHLQSSLIFGMRFLDFLKINRDRGVDLTKTEACLKKQPKKNRERAPE